MLFTVRKKHQKNLKFFIVGLLVVLLTFMAVLYTFQEKIIFRPVPLSLSHQFDFELPFEELFFETEPHTVINAILFKAENARGVILYFHGNAGNLQRWGEITSKLTMYNYDVLVIDYRTYGKSTGKLSEAGLYHDALFCYDWLLKQNYQNIVVYGRSLGAAIASYVASNRNVNQLILETPFYNIADVAVSRFKLFSVEKLIKYKFPNEIYATTINVPVTIIHGNRDRVVPLASARKLYNVYGLKAQFIEIDGAGHNNISDYQLYWQTVKSKLMP